VRKALKLIPPERGAVIGLRDGARDEPAARVLQDGVAGAGTNIVKELGLPLTNRSAPTRSSLIRFNQ
jgi:hypothetical protein